MRLGWFGLEARGVPVDLAGVEHGVAALADVDERRLHRRAARSGPGRGRCCRPWRRWSPGRCSARRGRRPRGHPSGCGRRRVAHDHDPVDGLAAGEELGLGDDRAAASGLAALATALLLGLEAGRALDARSARRSGCAAGGPGSTRWGCRRRRRRRAGAAATTATTARAALVVGVTLGVGVGVGVRRGRPRASSAVSAGRLGVRRASLGSRSGVGLLVLASRPRRCRGRGGPCRHGGGASGAGSLLLVGLAVGLPSAARRSRQVLVGRRGLVGLGARLGRLLGLGRRACPGGRRRRHGLARVGRLEEHAEAGDRGGSRRPRRPSRRRRRWRRRPRTSSSASTSMTAVRSTARGLGLGGSESAALGLGRRRSSIVAVSRAGHEAPRPRHWLGRPWCAIRASAGPRAPRSARPLGARPSCGWRRLRAGRFSAASVAPGSASASRLRLAGRPASATRAAVGLGCPRRCRGGCLGGGGSAGRAAAAFFVVRLAARAARGAARSRRRGLRRSAASASCPASALAVLGVVLGGEQRRRRRRGWCRWVPSGSLPSGAV